MQRIFYRTNDGLGIIDVSGKKTKTQIIAEFGAGDYLELDIDETVEGHKFDGVNLVSYSLADSEAETIARELAEKEKHDIDQQVKKQAREALRIKMKLTKDEFALLRGKENG